MSLILIVDDDEAVRGPLSAQMEALSHECHLGTNGEEAVAAVRAREYDLIISDIRMPGMDGLEFLKTVMPQIEFLTPVIILTGYNDVGARDPRDAGRRVRLRAEAVGHARDADRGQPRADAAGRPQVPPLLPAGARAARAGGASRT